LKSNWSCAKWARCFEAAINKRFGDGFGELTVAVVGLALAIWFVWFLYRRKIFLRV